MYLFLYDVCLFMILIFTNIFFENKMYDKKNEPNGIWCLFSMQIDTVDINRNSHFTENLNFLRKN